MTGPNRPDRWRIDMTEQEQLRQLKEEYENMTIPEAGRQRLKEGIDRARMEKKRAARARRSTTWAAVAAAVVVMVALPNTNMQIAHAMEDIPLLGGFFRLVTVRQYSYSSQNSSAAVDLARIEDAETSGNSAYSNDEDTMVGAVQEADTGATSGEGMEEATVAVQSDLADESTAKQSGMQAVNQDMEATVNDLIKQFEDALSEEGYHGLYVTQEVVTDNAQYYTVKLSALEIEASGYEHNKFYTLDKVTGEVVTLADLFAKDSDYISVISENIKSQMRQQMASDEDVTYFLDDDNMPEFNFQEITDETNFYFNEKGELVIAFDEYEVAPGSMGAPEFVIPQEIVEALYQ